MPNTKNNLEIPETNNRFFALRHGESQANVHQIDNLRTGLIVSNPKNGLNSYGLTELGKSQVRKTVVAAKEMEILDSDTIIYASDFLRTIETANIAAEILKIRGDIILTELLRERDFGTLELTSSENYQKVWEKDLANPEHVEFEVESVISVARRTSRLVRRLIKSQTSPHKNILLVSHGDSLQILETVFRKINPATHRSLKPLKTAEIRKLGKNRVSILP